MTGLGIAGIPVERRESVSNATDLVVNELMTDASGASERTVRRGLAVTETVASLWSRSLSAATVEPVLARAVLTPESLASIGRELFLTGQSFHHLRVSGGRLVAVPAGGADVRGTDSDPMSWLYRLDIAAPARTTSVTYSGTDVLHFRFGIRASVPWRGISPLKAAGSDLAVLGRIVHRIVREAGKTTGTVGAMSQDSGHTPEQAGDLFKTIKGIDGGTRLIGFRGSNLHRFRIAFQPDEQALQWPNATERRIMNAEGLSPALIVSESDGTAAREAFRRFTNTVLRHLASLVASEATAKLEQPVTLSFERLRGADVQGLGRAVKSLVDSRQSLADTLAAVGLDG